MSTLAAIVAFRKAREIVGESAVGRHIAAPLDFSDIRWKEEDDFKAHGLTLDEAFGVVRRALVTGYVKQGASITPDADGTELAETLEDKSKNWAGASARAEFFSQLTQYQEAGYLVGLAIGLSLARGGVR